MNKQLFLTIFLVTSLTSLFGQKDTLVKIYGITIDSMGNLKWKSDSYAEFGGQIEHFKNNKWVYAAGFGMGISEVEFADPSKSKNKPSIPSIYTSNNSTTVKFHIGINKYRFVINYPIKKIYPEFELKSNTTNDDGALWISGNQIILETKEYWEIISKKDGTLKKGDSKTVDITFLAKGEYFLYTQSWTKTFTKN